MSSQEPLDALPTEVADRPLAMAQFALMLLAKGRHKQGRELCERAIALAPDDAEVRALAAEGLSFGVPVSHFTIVQDHPRNAAYEAALRRAVTPGCRVLEIGSGSGLLAMMAARAGAGQVVTCEANPAVAKVAAEIIAENGFAGRVQQIAKRSGDLDVENDMGGRADILVSEILSNNLIGESVLPAVEQAVRRLLCPNARVIPARGEVRVALAEDKEAHRKRMGMVAGFDLSRFNRLAPPNYLVSVREQRIVLRGDVKTLFDFDFQSGGPFPQDSATIPLPSSGGRVNGIAQWLRLQMDETGTYENGPIAAADSATSAWAMVFYPLLDPIDMLPGEALIVHGAHDRLKMRIWAEVPESKR